MADGAESITGIQERFSDDVVAAGSFRDQHWVEVRRDHLIEIARWLKDERGYDVLLDVTAVHRPDDDVPYELVYHLYGIESDDRLRIKVKTTLDAGVDSLTGVWRSANWNERETYDMFGIPFAGHPDLRRILMPDDYTDFPLRKEFPLYRG